MLFFKGILGEWTGRDRASRAFATQGFQPIFRTVRGLWRFAGRGGRFGLGTAHALAVGFKAAGGCCVGVAAAFLGAVLMAKP